MIGPFELLLAFAVDCAVGDPKWLPHPVRLIGRAVSAGEAVLRRLFSDRVGGILLASSVTAAAYALTRFAVSFLRAREHGVLSVLASIVVVYLISTTLALRGLTVSVRDVYKAKDLEGARKSLSHIVGRDTGSLDDKGVYRAALESLSENASDGIIAPLFYLAIGGLPLAMAYKAVNTLDSMVGYKDERYKEFGWASARLDDVLNYIPARLTGVLIVAATCLISGFADAGRALSVMTRDGRKHTSPNSGYPEAAMAGALDVRFGGPSAYRGEVIEKPFIHVAGSEGYRAVGSDAITVVFLASVLGLFAASGSLLWRAQ